MKRFLLAGLVGLLLSLTSCGQVGPLYLPSSKEVPQNE